MTPDWKADKSLNWLDTWKAMEKVYQAHPEKVKAIGARLHEWLQELFSNHRLQVYQTCRSPISRIYSKSPL